MKKEAVRLPTFKGDESCSPFLKYPTWRKEWDKLIVEYDERWYSNILNRQLDEAAREQYVGYESDYNEAMKRLDAYYGNAVKVVDCILVNVDLQKVITGT